MPDTLTHYLFGLDTTKEISESPLYKTIKAHRNLFFIGLQGPDPMYYHAPYKKNNYAPIGARLHSDHTGYFLSSALCYAKKFANEPTFFEPCMAYVSGLICHYTLDTVCHPYIFYLGGRYDRTQPETTKYLGVHKQIELAIDALLLEERFEIPAHRFKIHQHVIKSVVIPDVILAMYDDLLFSIYAIPSGGKIFKESYKDFQNYFKLSYDRLGFKKGLVHSLKPLLPKDLVPLVDTFSYHGCIDEFEDYLNPNKKVWLHPVTGNVYTYSFADLLRNAHKLSRIRLLSAYAFTQSETTLEEVEALLPNISYLTGLPITDTRPMKYFKF